MEKILVLVGSHFLFLRYFQKHLTKHPIMSAIKPTDFYKKTFLKANPEQQAAFLEQLFARDKDLRSQFDTFITNWETTNTTEKQPVLSFIDLEEYRNEVHIELSEMSFDMESVYDHFRQGDRRYVPQYEAAWEGAENILREEGFQPFFKEAKDFLKKGNLLDGVKVLLAIYEGHNDVFEPGFDEEEVFQEYNANCLDIFKENMAELLPFIKGITADSEEAILTIFDLIIERLQYWEAQYEESLAKSEYEDHNVVYNLEVLEPLFLVLLINAKVASHLEELLLKNDLKDKDTSKVFLKISKLKGSQKDWEKTAETYATKDKNIMQQLLDKYQKEGKEKDWYRVAKKAFNHFSYQMSASLLKDIDPAKDEAFYLKVLTYQVRQNRKIDSYKKLRPYLNTAQRTSFIETQRKWMDFYTDLLAVEGREEEILAIAQAHSTSLDIWSSDTGNFYHIVGHLLEKYPDESYEMLQQRVQKALKHGRDRGVYATVTKWMERMLRIKGYEAKAQQFVQDIAQQFYNFSALKDEMRKGGVL